MCVYTCVLTALIKLINVWLIENLVFYAVCLRHASDIITNLRIGDVRLQFEKKACVADLVIDKWQFWAILLLWRRQEQLCKKPRNKNTKTKFVSISSFSIISPLFHLKAILSKLTKLLINSFLHHIVCIWTIQMRCRFSIYIVLFKHFLHLFLHTNIYRSSRPEVFCKKGFLTNFIQFMGKDLWKSLFFSQIAGLRENTCCRTPLVTASVFKNVDFPNLEDRVTHETKAEHKSFYHRRICALCICIP